MFHPEFWPNLSSQSKVKHITEHYNNLNGISHSETLKHKDTNLKWFILKIQFQFNNKNEVRWGGPPSTPTPLTGLTCAAELNQLQFPKQCHPLEVKMGDVWHSSANQFSSEMHWTGLTSKIFIKHYIKSLITITI